MTKQELIKEITAIKGKSHVDLNTYTEDQLEFHLHKLQQGALRPNRTRLGDFMRGISVTPATVRPVEHVKHEEHVEERVEVPAIKKGVALTGFDAVNQNQKGA